MSDLVTQLIDAVEQSIVDLKEQVVFHKLGYMPITPLKDWKKQESVASFK